MNRRPKVSVIILSWNTLEETKACVESVQKLSYKNKEVVVVDNGSTDGSKDYLSSLGSKIKYIDLEVNTGFAGGQIIAEEHATGEFLALINSDAVVAKEWLDVLVSDMLKDDKLAAVGGKSFQYNSEQPAYDTSNNFYTYQVIDPRLGYAETLQTGDAFCNVNSVSGAGVLIRRATIKEVGYFDKAFFAYYEETDLFARYKRAGFKIAYNPNAHIWHMIGASTKTDSGPSYFYLRQMHRNRYRYAFKNFDHKHIYRLSADYWLKFLRSGYLMARKRGDLDHKARFFAGLWLLPRMPRVLYDRVKIQRLGSTYNKLFEFDAAEVVTIVIPCYNYQDYVSEAIDSALKQTILPARVIVINDGSKDESMSVINKFKSKVEVIDQKNIGIIATKNKGLAMTNSEYVLFLDADDVLSKDYIQKTLYTARLNKADVVYTDVEHFGNQNQYLKAGKFSGYRIQQSNFIHNSALNRTSTLKSINGYKKEMSGGYEDWELYISAYETGAKFKYINKSPILYYRQHDSEVGRNKDAIAKDLNLRKKVASLHPRLIIAHVGKPDRSMQGLSKRFLSKMGRTPYKPRDIKFHLEQTYHRSRDIAERRVFQKSLFFRRARGAWWKLKKGDLRAVNKKIDELKSKKSNKK